MRVMVAHDANGTWLRQRPPQAIRRCTRRVSASEWTVPLRRGYCTAHPVTESKRTYATGALNQLEGIAHRRDALWQVERAGKLEGPLLRQESEWLRKDNKSMPLRQMNVEEHLVADYAGTGLTVGKHLMHYRRREL